MFRQTREQGKLMKEFRQVPEGDAGPPAALVSRHDRYIA